MSLGKKAGANQTGHVGTFRGDTSTVPRSGSFSYATLLTAVFLRFLEFTPLPAFTHRALAPRALATGFTTK